MFGFNILKERGLHCCLVVLLLSVVFASLYCAAPRQEVVYRQKTAYVVGEPTFVRSDLLEVHREYLEKNGVSDVLSSTIPDSGGGQRQDKEASEQVRPSAPPARAAGTTGGGGGDGGGEDRPPPATFKPPDANVGRLLNNHPLEMIEHVLRLLGMYFTIYEPDHTTQDRQSTVDRIKQGLKNNTMEDEILSFVASLPPYPLNVSTRVWGSDEVRKKYGSVAEHWCVLIGTLRSLVDGDSVQLFRCVFWIMDGGARSYHSHDFKRDYGRAIIHELYRNPDSGLRDVFTLEQFDAAWTERVKQMPKTQPQGQQPAGKQAASKAAARAPARADGGGGAAGAAGAAGGAAGGAGGDDDDQRPRRPFVQPDGELKDLITGLDRNTMDLILKFLCSLFSLFNRRSQDYAAANEDVAVRLREELRNVRPDLNGTDMRVLRFSASMLPYQLDITPAGDVTQRRLAHDVRAWRMSTQLFWAAMVQAFRFAFGNNNLRVMEAVFIMMQSIIDDRQIGDFDYKMIIAMIKKVRDDPRSGLLNLVTDSAMKNMENRLEKHADRDRINEANLHGDRALMSWLTMPHDMLKDIAVKIMSLYMAILTSGQMSPTNNLQNFVNAFERQYGNVWSDFAAVIRRMIRFVVPQWVDYGNMPLGREYMETATAHFTEAVDFLYRLFDFNIGDDVYKCKVLMSWIRSLYNYLNYVEHFRKGATGLKKYSVAKCMTDQMAMSQSFMHRITNDDNVQEQIDKYNERREATNAAAAARPALVRGQKRGRDGAPVQPARAPVGAGSIPNLEDIVERRHDDGREGQRVDIRGRPIPEDQGDQSPIPEGQGDRRLTRGSRAAAGSRAAQSAPQARAAPAPAPEAPAAPAPAADEHIVIDDDEEPAVPGNALPYHTFIAGPDDEEVTAIMFNKERFAVVARPGGDESVRGGKLYRGKVGFFSQMH